MRHSIIVLSLSFFFIQFLICVSVQDGQAPRDRLRSVRLSSAIVRAVLCTRLLRDFSLSTNFESKVTQGILTHEQLSVIVDSSLRSYQEQSQPVILPHGELKKHITASLVSQERLVHHGQ